jgi:RimJ/RimL family protein N-acetyltransferase
MPCSGEVVIDLADSRAVARRCARLHTRRSGPAERAGSKTTSMNVQTLIAPASTTVIAPAPVSWQTAPPTLVGAHVTLRELEPSDAFMLLPLVAAPEVARFISAPPASVDRFASFIEWSRRERAAGRYIAFGIVPAGHDLPVGLVQLRQLDSAFRGGEWGFALGSSFWGAGFFVEAARLLIDFAFDRLGVHRLEARAAIDNARGQSAMRKLGAVQEGVLRQSLQTADGRYHDQVLWSLLADDWRAASAVPVVRVH